MKTEFDNNLIDQFEDEIKAGNSPTIESYLSQWPEESKPRILLELISLEIFHSLRKGRPVRNVDYSHFGEQAVEHANRVREQFSNSNGIKGSECDTHSNAPSDTSFPKGDSTLPPSQRIGPYKLLEKIGEGGMGSVWKAQQEQPVRRQVALKLIKSGVADQQTIARFEAERQALALMDHENIAKVLDAGTTDEGTPYFVMELVDGESITKYCDVNKLKPDDRLNLFVQTCDAVQHAHHKGIAHRDLKPSNILVHIHNGQPRVKVIDFGLAKAMEHQTKLTDKTVFTEFGNILGTLQYMSPEQATLDTIDIDTRTDVYSLGVVLYELLAGSSPITAETLKQNNLLEVLELIREQDPPRPSQRLSSSDDSQQSISDLRQIQFSKLRQILRGELDWIIMRALEKDRARRYATPNDFAEDIDRYINGEAVLARPPSATYRFRKFVLKNKIPVGIVAGLLTLVTGSAITIAGALANANVARAEAVASATEAEESAAEALVSAERSEKILTIVGDSFYAPNPESGATADMSAKDVLLKAKESLDTSDLDDLGKIHLLAQLCSSFTGLGQYDLAVQVAEERRDLSDALLGLDHLDTLVAMSALADSYLRAGRTDEGIELITKTLPPSKAKLGPDHPETLSLMASLAAGYNSAGRLDEAIELEEQTLELRKAKLGLDHLDTLISMGNLAACYRDSGRTDEAIGLEEQTLGLRTSNLGQDHPLTLEAMNNLALSFCRAGRTDAAIELNEQTLELRKAKLGPDHPNTLVSMNNLAAAYNIVGRASEALKLQEQTLELVKAKLGPDHPHTLGAMANLANSYYRARRTDEAIKLHEQALELRKAKLGPDHVQTIGSMANLAASYVRAGRANDALKLYEQTLQLQNSNLGADHSTTLALRLNLAGGYRVVGRLDESIELDEQTLELSNAKLGPDHSYTLSSMGNLALSYAATGQHQKLLELRKRRLERLREKLGSDHPDTINAMLKTIRMLVKSPELVSSLDPVVIELRKLSESAPTELILRMNAIAEYRSGNFAAGISAAESAIENSTGQVHPFNYAILALSHFHLDEIESANDNRQQFSEAMKFDKIKDDKDCLLFADEVEKLFSSKPVATESGSED